MEIIQFLIDFALHIDKHLAELVANYNTWVYAILFLIVFCETGLIVTPFLPGDSLLFVAGTLAALDSNNLNLLVLILVLVAAAILGDSVNFEVGKYFGEKLFKNKDSKIFKQSYLDKTHQFYKKYGGKTIVIARFVPIVRTFAPFVAGMGKMSYKYFILYNITGAIVWVSLFLLLGYFVGNFEFVQKNLRFIIFGIIFVSILPAVFEVLKAKLKNR